MFVRCVLVVCALCVHGVLGDCCCVLIVCCVCLMYVSCLPFVNCC